MPITSDIKTISTNPNYIKKATIRARTNMNFILLFALQAQKLSKQVPKNANNNTKCPVLIIQSGKDIFTNFDKIEKNNNMWRTGITYNFYEEGNHAILNESNINIILQDVLTWIEREYITLFI